MPSETEDESKRKPSQLGILGSGQVVYDRDKSHVELHRDVADYLLKALRRINIKSLENQAFIKTITFDEVIGVSTCVVTTRTGMKLCMPEDITGMD